MKLELPKKFELIKTTGEQVPERYIYQLPNKAPDQSLMKYVDSPIIDFNLLSTSSLQQHEQELNFNPLSVPRDTLHSSYTNKCFGLLLEVNRKHSKTVHWNIEDMETIQFLRIRVITGMTDCISKFILLIC